MNVYLSSSSRRLRRLLIASAIVGLAALGISHLDRRADEGIPSPSERARSVEGVREGPRMAPMLYPSVAAIDKAAAREESRNVAQIVYAPQPVAPQPTPLPFKLLAKAQESDASILLLYRGGRVLAIRNAIPADDDYVVDALTEDYVVLRQLSTNESQIIQLVAREEAVSTGWSDTSPD